MLFSSLEFVFVFLPVVLLVYGGLSRLSQPHYKKVWLIAASLFFYGYWKPIYLVLIVGSMLVNFAIGRLMLRSRVVTEVVDSRHFLARLTKKQYLVMGIVLNLCLLGFFKYVDFFIANINWLVGSQIPGLDLLLPLAISFFTFQQIAYLVDCYKQEAKEYDFLNYALFVTFFPQLIAGPIVHHKQMMPQFASQKRGGFKLYNLYTGALIFAIGLFKKVVVADTFAIWANVGFENTESLHFFDAWLTSLSYSFQLYYDFSGYSDMAIGAALLFNIRLPVNFNSPYQAVSIQDFWRRWHITLSNWLRDYVYIPLGGSRKGKALTFINVFLTMLIGGLWHGAGWTFVIWGAMHGGALALHRAWSLLGMRLHAFLGWLLTFIFVLCSWVMFRAASPTDAINVYQAMFSFDDLRISQNFNVLINWFFNTPLTTVEQEPNFISSPVAYVWLAVFSLVVFCSKNTMVLSGFYERRIVGRSYLMPVIAGTLFAAATIKMLTTPVSDFLYFNF